MELSGATHHSLRTLLPLPSLPRLPELAHLSAGPPVSNQHDHLLAHAQRMQPPGTPLCGGRRALRTCARATQRINKLGCMLQEPMRSQIRAKCIEPQHFM